ncbi:MAG: hypothetical protein ACI97N_000257 [Cognaticolwellia sp.]
MYFSHWYKSTEKMKSIWGVLTILIVFSFSCDDYKPKHGIPTIDEETMAKMVSDIHIIEAYAQNVKATERDSVKSVFYQALFKVYDIDTTEFYKNQRLYYENPVATEKLYEDVLKILDEKNKKEDSKLTDKPEKRYK